MVHLVQVDVVGLQPLERTFHRLADVQRGELLLVRPVAHAPVHLCGHHHFLAPAAALGKPASHNLLGGAFADLPAVDIGGIEEINAEFERLIHNGEGVFLFRLGPEVHRPQAQPGNLQASPAKLCVFHIYLQKITLFEREQMGNRVHEGFLVFS